MIAWTILALAAAVDPCAQVEPAPEPDPAAAEAYLEVAEHEQRSGALDTAATAFRSALRANPRSGRARAGLLAVCRRTKVAQQFDEAVRRMESGDRRGAIALFEQIRASGPDPASALLEGICRYELEEHEQAVPLLREAEGDPSLAASARLFLGLVSLREGGVEQAARSFEAAASADPAMAPAAAGLLKLARREGHLVLSMLVGPSADSNVDLAPDGAPTAGGSGDAAGTVAGLLLARPLGESGPFLRASGTYRKLGRFTAFDLGVAEGAAGWQIGREPRHVLAEYAYDFLALGGARYLSAHRLLAEGRWTFDHISLGASYAARFESFLTSAAAPYSGLRHAAELGGEWRFGRGSAIGLAYVGVRDGTDDATLTYLEHGPRAYGRLVASPTLRLAVEASVLGRRYDAPDPAFGLSRADVYLDGAASAELDFADRWTARFWAAARKSFSNVSAFAYTELSGGFTLSLVLGLL